MRLNIESIDLPAEAFDLVCCCHVLEHVDDKRAIPELYRILAREGLLIAMVPIVEGWERTFECDSVSNDRQRLLYFGQRNHVRFYGRDIRERLTASGFVIDEFVAEEPAVSNHGLTRGERVLLCWKR